MVTIVATLQEVRINVYFILISESSPYVIGRAGLTTGQTGQMPGASRLNIKTFLYWIFMFLGYSPRLKIVEIFDYCVYHRLRNLTNLAFIVFEWLKRIKPNRITLSDPRIRSKSVHPRASVEIVPGRGNVEILLFFFLFFFFVQYFVS